MKGEIIYKLQLYYKDEYIRLFQGDCLEVMDKLIEKEIKVDAIITDPPYGTTACKWDAIIPFDEMWSRINQLIKSNKMIGLFAQEPFASVLRMSNIKNYKHEWYWDKEVAGNFVQAKNHPLKVIENIIVFSNNKVDYMPMMEQAKEENKRPRGQKYSQKTDFLGKVSQGEFKCSDNHNEDLRYPKNLITFNARTGDCNNVNRVHPTQKPVELIEYLINTYTKEKDVILDFTCGSGSTLVAAKKLNRKCIGIELEEKYCEIAKNRLTA